MGLFMGGNKMKHVISVLAVCFFVFLFGCCIKPNKIHTKRYGSEVSTSYFIEISYIVGEDSIMKITGSGAAISNTQDNRSLVITAGHVCKGDPNLFFIAPDILIKDVYGNVIEARIFAIDEGTDLCLLEVESNLQITKIAKSSPKILDNVHYVGYPAGLYFQGILHRLEGNYSGVDPFGNDVWSFPAISGASGSPVYNNDSELIGIISAVHIEFHHVVMGASLEKIKEFMARFP